MTTAAELAELVGVANRLRVDRWTAEVVLALRAAAVEPVLLKGPTVAAWLYAGEPLARSYHDVDLLIRPGDMPTAEAVLRQVGFGEPELVTPGEAAPHARACRRAGDGAEVDLHRCLHGMEDVPPERLWPALETHLETHTVAGVEVTVLDEVVRTLHVVLHVHGTEADRSAPRTDLRRAADLVDQATWAGAAALARELGIEAAFAARLRAVPETAALADTLGLAATVDTRFVSRQGPVGVVAIHRLLELRGRERATYIVRKVFPPAAFLRQRSELAQRGAAGLAAAYAARFMWCISRAPAAVAGWGRVRRLARR